MKRITSILLCLLFAFAATASPRATKHVADVCSINSGAPDGSKIYKLFPHSAKKHTFIKKNGLRVRYMKAEIRYTLTYFDETVVYSTLPVIGHTFFYSDPFFSDHHRLYKLRGPPAHSLSQV